MAAGGRGGDAASGEGRGEGSGDRLFVGGVVKGASESDLQRALRAFGEVASVELFPVLSPLVLSNLV